MQLIGKGWNLQMNFTNGLPTFRPWPDAPIPMMIVMMMMTIVMRPWNPPKWFFSNYSRSFFSLLINHNFIGAMDLIITKHPVLQNKPSRPPSFPIIHPFIQNPRNTISHYIINLDLTAVMVLTLIVVVITENTERNMIRRGITRRQNPGDREILTKIGRRHVGVALHSHRWNTAEGTHSTEIKIIITYIASE